MNMLKEYGKPGQPIPQGSFYGRDFEGDPAPRMNFHAEKGMNATTAGTHEYEHALDDAGAMTAPYHAEIDKKDGLFQRFSALNRFTGPVEAPAVFAESVAAARNLAQTAPDRLDKLRLGDPRYHQTTGRFLHDQGSRYMYGRDPYTDAKIAPQRSMSELLMRPEGRQWLQRMGTRDPGWLEHNDLSGLIHPDAFQISKQIGRQPPSKQAPSSSRFEDMLRPDK
jgi:hypothetical protein